MEKVVRIVKKGSEDSNLDYWLSLSFSERMQELEKIRLEVNQRLYGDYKGFQRVFKVVKREKPSQIDRSKKNSKPLARLGRCRAIGQNFEKEKQEVNVPRTSKSENMHARSWMSGVQIHELI